MFIKIWQLIILYIDRMDWRAGHLTTTEGTRGRAFANKNCPRGRAFEIFFKCPGYARGFARGGCLRLELTRTLDNSVERYYILIPGLIRKGIPFLCQKTSLDDLFE